MRAGPVATDLPAHSTSVVQEHHGLDSRQQVLPAPAFRNAQAIASGVRLHRGLDHHRG